MIEGWVNQAISLSTLAVRLAAAIQTNKPGQMWGVSVRSVKSGRNAAHQLRVDNAHFGVPDPGDSIYFNNLVSKTDQCGHKDRLEDFIFHSNTHGSWIPSRSRLRQALLPVAAKDPTAILEFNSAALLFDARVVCARLKLTDWKFTMTRMDDGNHATLVTGPLKNGPKMGKPVP
ncbi:uncharacterized protein BDR25DRAFT_356931 [Lindgomyces ingoldianus]|uniref:Uncharacterized protein n=1 Tax=Lindgomyces ingoldianus TaxID=673940 RepID=A0ACB6QRF0_9PLEO|nr:uncharacterized protein BDR25DRAFT_356931 [Lindgomyces ingoldianus]KAF2469148.1 hypothetical protein BDR25DRAFT_356931 [Lindgomyces ingoldianus]